MFKGYARRMTNASNFNVQDGAASSVLVPIDIEIGFDILCTDVAPSTNLFGGSEMWPDQSSDFIMIAECSEIHGPNPIVIIPSTYKATVDLNLLSVLILSADYQDFSSKNLSFGHSQVLMPDIMTDIHALVNHFVIYDSEARGFVRALCAAYITSDKHKLTSFDEEILNCLKEASSLIQHSNKKFSIKGLKELFQNLELTESKNTSTSEENCSYNLLIKNSLKEVQDVLNSINFSSVLKDADKIIEKFVHDLKCRFEPEGFDFSFKGSESEPPLLKLPQNCNDSLKSLLVVSPEGILVAFYHLYLTYKYFRRKLEDIYLENSCDIKKKSLCFGVCLKLNSWVKGESERYCDAIFCEIPPNPVLYSTNYTSYIDSIFCMEVLHFFKSTFGEQCNLKLKNLSTSSALGNTESAIDFQCTGHIVPLNRLWNNLNYLSCQIPGIESSFLKFLQFLPWSEVILYSLFTRIPLVIFYNLEDEFFVSNVIRVLATIAPNPAGHSGLVEHNSEKVLQKKNLNGLRIITYCIHEKNSKFISSEILPYISLILLCDLTFQGPQYKGSLLQNLNSKIKAFSPNKPFFPFLISIFSDIELQLKFYESVSELKECQSIMTRRGFTTCDIKILKCLSCKE